MKAQIEGTARIEFERNVAIACAQPGDERWAATWNDGQVMRLDQAIALTLETSGN